MSRCVITNSPVCRNSLTSGINFVGMTIALAYLELTNIHKFIRLLCMRGVHLMCATTLTKMNIDALMAGMDGEDMPAD